MSLRTVGALAVFLLLAATLWYAWEAEWYQGRLWPGKWHLTATLLAMGVLAVSWILDERRSGRSGGRESDARR